MIVRGGDRKTNVNVGPTRSQMRLPTLPLQPPADYQRKVFRDFAEMVMPAFR